MKNWKLYNEEEIEGGIERYWKYVYNLVDRITEFDYEKDFDDALNFWKNKETQISLSKLLKDEGCTDINFSYMGKKEKGGFLNLMISFNYDKDQPPKKVIDELESICKKYHMMLDQTRKDYYSRKFKYVKTYEDYQGQILAGNTANSAEMNVNVPMDKQAGKGDAVMINYAKSDKPIPVKILSIKGNNLYHVTLNVEGSPFNKKGVNDEDNAIEITFDQIIGPYAGLRNPTGSGHVTQNTNIDVVAKTGGQVGANDGTGNFGANTWPGDNSGFGL